MNSKMQAKNTVKIASRTSVQSEPVVSSDGIPSLKYVPVVLYPEKDDTNGNKVFSLDDDNVSAKDFSLSPEDDKEIGKDTRSSEEEKLHTADIDTFSAEPKTMIKWRRLDKESVKTETESMGKTKGLECGFCEQEQVNSKLLPCFHSFCRECLQKLVCVHNGRHWIKCPLCKKKVNLSSKSLNGVEDNIYMKFSNASPQSDDKMCEMCQLQPPKYICTECQTDLCTDCVGKHLTSLLARDHSIQNIPENKTEEESEAVCEIHKTFTLELFCNTCSEPICGRCAINKHLNHVTEDIAVSASEKRKSLIGMLNDNVTTRILRNLRENLVSNRKEKARLRSEISKIIDEIRQYMEKLKTDIEKMGLRLIEELKGNEEVWLSSLDKKFQEAECKQRSAEQILTTARSITESARDVNFIRKYGHLKTAVQFVKKIGQPALQSLSCQFIPLSKPGLFGRVKMNASLTRAIEFYDLGKASFQKGEYTVFVQLLIRVRGLVTEKLCSFARRTGNSESKSSWTI